MAAQSVDQPSILPVGRCVIWGDPALSCQHDADRTDHASPRDEGENPRACATAIYGACTLGARVAFARTHDADLLIAVHADASPDHDERRASVHISNRAVTTALPRQSRQFKGHCQRPRSPEPGSALLQYSMIDQLDDDVRMVETPARHAQHYVLGSRTIPSVLLEIGFLSNRRDEALLRQAAHQRVVVQAVRDTVEDYFATIKHPDSRT